MHDYPAIVRYWFYVLAAVALSALVSMLFLPGGTIRGLAASISLLSLGTAGLSVVLLGLIYGHVPGTGHETVGRKQSQFYFWFHLLFWLTSGLIFSSAGLYGLLERAQI